MLRAIEEGRAGMPAAPPRNWWRRLAVVAAVVAVGAGAGWLVARSSGQRLGGQEITGGAAVSDVATMLAQARALLGVDPLQAQQLYERVLDERPDHAEALAYSGWLLFTASAGASDEVRATAVATAKQQLERSVAADETYADPHCFLAVIAADAETSGDGAHGGRDVPRARPAGRCPRLRRGVRRRPRLRLLSFEIGRFGPLLNDRTAHSVGGGSAAASVRPSSRIQTLPLRHSGGVVSAGAAADEGVDRRR